MNAVTCDAVVRLVAERRGITVKRLFGDERTVPVAEARAVAALLCRWLVPGASLSAIGRALGWKDHSTVLGAIRRIEERRALDEALSDELEVLKLQLGQGESAPEQHARDRAAAIRAMSKAVERAATELARAAERLGEVARALSLMETSVTEAKGEDGR